MFKFLMVLVLATAVSTTCATYKPNKKTYSHHRKTLHHSKSIKENNVVSYIPKDTYYFGNTDSTPTPYPSASAYPTPDQTPRISRKEAF